jgi:hypothetical protein
MTQNYTTRNCAIAPFFLWVGAINVLAAHRLPRRCGPRFRDGIGSRLAILCGVTGQFSENQQVAGTDREKVPSGALKILPYLRSWSEALFLQVPVVAPAGFRSPGKTELDAAPPARSPRTGFGQPGERYRIPRAVRTTGYGNPYTCAIQGSESVLRRDFTAVPMRPKVGSHVGSIVGIERCIKQGEWK